jgi:hypothetical protein
MRALVRGSDTQNFMRRLGRLSPSSGTLQLYANIAAIPLTLGASTAIGAAGATAKAIADQSTKSAGKDLSRLVRAGGDRAAITPAPNAVQQLAESEREALIRALMSAGIIANSP